MTGNFNENTLMVAPQLNWVKTIKYCELSGETKDAVNAKRKNGLWIEGLQWKIAPDGKVRINLHEVDLWVQYNGNIPARLKSRQGCRRATPKPVTA